MRTYVASPLGFTASGREWSNAVLLPALRAAGCEIVDPWALSEPAEWRAAADAGLEAQRALALEVGARNSAAIRSCELLVAVLDGQEVDSGTAAEVGYAAALGLRVEALRTDLRQSGEAGVAVNLQVEHFVVASGGRVAAGLDALVERVAQAAAGAKP